MQATFSSARHLFLNQGRVSVSIHLTNDHQLISESFSVIFNKSNSLSFFYCQNAPRTIHRPNQNLLDTMNNYSFLVFLGGIASYSDGVPNYGTVTSNQCENQDYFSESATL